MAGGTLSARGANEEVTATFTCVEGRRVEHDQVVAAVAELKVELVELIGVRVTHLDHLFEALLAFEQQIFLHAPQEPSAWRVRDASLAESGRLTIATAG